MDNTTENSDRIKQTKIANDKSNRYSEGFSARLIHLLKIAYPEKTTKQHQLSAFLSTLTDKSQSSARRWLTQDEVPNFTTLRTLLTRCHNELQLDSKPEPKNSLLSLEIWIIYGDKPFGLSPPSISKPPVLAQPLNEQDKIIPELFNDVHDTQPNKIISVVVMLLKLTIRLLSSIK